MDFDRSLEQVLQSVSDVLFPAESGQATVSLDSVGYDGDSPLHVLIWRNDTDGALQLIENKADVNAKGEMDETPLHAALHQGNMRVVSALLEFGARKDLASEFGETADQLAKDKGIDLNEFK